MKIGDCSAQLAQIRDQITHCVNHNRPVSETLQQQAFDCIAHLKHLQCTMKQDNAMHRESKRIVRRTCAVETKYNDSKSRSSANQPIIPPIGGWFSSPQIPAIEQRLNQRLKHERGKFKTRERIQGSPPP